MCLTHSTLPHIAVLHSDKILRVLSVTKQFDQLRTVQSTTLWKANERLWLARIDRNVPAKALAAAFAAFVDSLGFVVYQASAKGAARRRVLCAVRARRRRQLNNMRQARSWRACVWRRLASCVSRSGSTSSADAYCK